MIQQTKGCAVILAAIVCGASAGALGTTPDAGALHVRVFPGVVHAGEPARVEVLASFPAPVYAFASARYSVLATSPAWRSVSAGRVVGDDVVGILSSQPHTPQQGVFANPANPYSVWTGVLAPEVRGPALVEVSAAPRDFRAYPSRWTGSSVPLASEGGRDLLFVDPLRVGLWAAAPRAGTRSTVSDDVIVDGRIITGENPQSIGLGLLPLSARAPHASDVRVEFERVPDAYTSEVQIESDAVPVDSFSLNWAKIDYRNSGGHTEGVVVAAGPGGGPHVKVRLALGVSVVYSGTLPRADATESWSFMLPAVPPEQHIEVGGLVYSGESGGIMLSERLSYERPVIAVVRGADGRARRVTVDAVEIETPVNARPVRATNNLHQIGLAAHTFEARGVEVLRLQPRSTE